MKSKRKKVRKKATEVPENKSATLATDINQNHIDCSVNINQNHIDCSVNKFDRITQLNKLGYLTNDDIEKRKLKIYKTNLEDINTKLLLSNSFWKRLEKD